MKTLPPAPPDGDPLDGRPHDHPATPPALEGLGASPLNVRCNVEGTPLTTGRGHAWGTVNPNARPFWAAAPKGPMTYAVTHRGNFSFSSFSYVPPPQNPGPRTLDQGQ